MMKILILLYFICACACPVISQKHNYYWFTGYEYNSTFQQFGGTTFDFSGDSLVIYKEDKPMSFAQTHGVMCDSVGKLLFYTNGMYIANAEHDTMVNGSGLNPGWLYDAWINAPYAGYRIRDGVIILPDLKTKNTYKIFHKCYPEFNNGTPQQLLSTTVDMDGDGGLGEVIEKNKIIYHDTGKSLTQSHFDAVRHANGRDWWLATMIHETKELLLHLYTPDSIYKKHTQVLVPHSVAGVGEFQFSPDGSMLAITELRIISTAKVGHSLHLYAFDRCSGQFAPMVNSYVEDTIIFNNGVIFSPSGRYLYQNYDLFVFRYDLEAADIIGSKDTIATWDGYIWYPWEGSPKFHTWFGYGELGPDGNIYIMSASASPFIHKITWPDDPAKSEVIQRIPIPTANGWTVPNYPNYRLGALEGSPCAEMFGPPTAQFDYVPDALSVSFEDQSAGVPLAWYWTFGDGATATEQHPQHTYADPGVYTVCLATANLYGTSSICRDVKVEPSSVDDQDDREWGLKVIPNPARGQVYIGMSASVSREAVELNLFNTLGQQVLRRVINPHSGEASLTIPLEGLPTGLYMLQVLGRRGHRWTENLMVE